jgi:asparagine synthase (glutamine-hydrolysing)
MKAWRAVISQHLTYSEPTQLSVLLRLIRDIERRGDEGEIIETGCALGGSAILMCSTKAPTRPLRVFDVFGMIPPPSQHDGPDMQERYEVIASGKSDGLGGHAYYAYDKDLKATVTRNFAALGFPVAQNNVTLIAGKVQDTLEVTGPVALAHIDVDWFEPVTACLDRIVPKLSPNGSVMLRAYGCWSGCRKATDEYFERVGRSGFRMRMIGTALLAQRSST